MNDISTINDGSDLNAAETRLLETLMDPSAVGLTITAKCQRANVSRQLYYTAIRRQHFQEALKKCSLDLVRERLGDVVQAAITSATSGNYRGYNDRRLILEMAGLYRPGQDFNIVASPGQPAPASDAEVEERMAQLLSKYLPETASKGEE